MRNSEKVIYKNIWPTKIAEMTRESTMISESTMIRSNSNSHTIRTKRIP